HDSVAPQGQPGGVSHFPSRLLCVPGVRPVRGWPNPRTGHPPATNRPDPGNAAVAGETPPAGHSWAGWWPNRPNRPPRRSGDVAPVPAMRWPTTTPGYSQQPPRGPVPRAFGDPPGVAQLGQRSLDCAARVAGGLLQLGGGRLPPGVAQRLDDRG